MVDEGKCIEYYFDSKTFTKEELIKNIEEAQIEFPNKKIEPELFLNQWGVYILKINFKDKIKYMTEIKRKRTDKKVKNLIQKNQKVSKKRMSLFNREYGKYKNSGEYKPI
ncbi:MAG: hypothetical protein ACLS90_02390 [Clostridia bacterium]|mgnify:CR=1 FL=1